MKKGDFIWGGLLLLFSMIFVFESSRTAFIGFTGTYPLLGGFLKFMLLATMGELLSIRISTGEWINPGGLPYRALVWGFLGVVITLIFNIYGAGVTASMNSGILPFAGSAFAFAFFTSAFMNLTFAPTFMAFHRITDTLIDAKVSGQRQKIRLKEITAKIDWYGFISFVVMKTIPIFWIPAHTITFLLPGEYRVVVAAYLSVALGAILAFSKKLKSA